MDNHSIINHGQPEAQSLLLKEKEAAAMMNISTGLMRRFRNAGSGPAFIKLPSGSVRYRICDIDEFLRQRVVKNASMESGV